MNTSFSPRRYRAALLDHFNASSSPVAPPPSARSRKGLCIENSSLLGNHFHDLDASWRANSTSHNISRETSRNPRSTVIDFIDQCVANHVPESVIVEHVLFMIRAMQEQISMTGALHAQYHQDRLRHYEMSELTNMLERQQVYYEQVRSTTTHPHVCPNNKYCSNENNRSAHRNASDEHGRVVSYAVETIPVQYTTPGDVPRKGVNLKRSSLSHNQPSRATLTEQPTNAAAARGTKDARDHSYYTHEKHTLRPRTQSVSRSGSIQRLLRPTEASIRKGRCKHEAATVKEAPPSAMCRVAAGNRRGPNDSAAVRGRQRRITGTLALRGSAPAATVSTWSDEDDEEEKGSQLSLRLPASAERGDQEERRVTETSHNASLDPPSSLDWHSAGSAAPPLSVGVPSQTAASLRLQAYIEHSERKIRESERLLVSTPSGKLPRERGGSFSPLSGEISELSED